MDADDPIEAAWRQLEATWDDEAAHKKFLALCAATDRMAEAGRRYREVRESDPERAEVAKAQIDRLLVMAMQNLEALKTEPTQRSGKTVMFLVALGVSLSLIVTALWTWLRFM